MAQHSEETGLNIHVPYAWEYADETEREAATGFVAADVGKFARQIGGTPANSIWMLTATTPTWVAVGGDSSGAGSMVFVESHSASNSATLDFTSLSDTYNDYILKITGLIPASAGNNLIVRFATNATPTWDSGNNYRWGRVYWNMAAATGGTGDGGATSNIQIGAVIATTTGYSFNADIRFSNLRTAALYKSLNSRAEQLISSDSNLYGIHSMGYWLNNSVKAFGIRLLMSSGNISSGLATLYGIKDS